MNGLIGGIFLLAVTAVGGFAAGALRQVAAAYTENRLLSEIADAVADAVACVSQTYVDELKELGKFDEEAQKIAVTKALAACMASLSESAKDFITNNYGDIAAYLTRRIEAQVRLQKL